MKSDFENDNLFKTCSESDKTLLRKLIAAQNAQGNFGPLASKAQQSLHSWYRCEACDKNYCSMFVRMKCAIKDIKFGSSKVVVELINSQNEAEREKRLNINLGEKLSEIRSIRRSVRCKKVGLKNLYHETFLLRILGMLDFYCSLAGSSPATMTFIQ